MSAVVCPISRSQPAPLQPQVKLPTPPIATDLPSLIRSINIISDVLRQITSSLTVNNTWEARPPPPPPGQISYKMSPYPEWDQNHKETSEGYVFHSDKNGKDPSQRVHVVRTNLVEFRNRHGNDTQVSEYFIWKYYRPLDA